MNIDIAFKYNMLPRGTKLLCAVSGGADSMCLLHLMNSMQKELSIQVFCAHFEHGIRGEEALRDADFVENWCDEQGILCVTGHGNVPAYAKKQHMGIEEAARELRYEFLKKTAKELECTKIATAHNADDNAETVIFNLCRGSGGTGLRGIPPVRDEFIRPLLGCTREEIENYLRENRIPHVEDSSNLSDDYSRNLIRHKVMPVLREINPGASKAALRASELLRQDEDCISEIAENFIKENYQGGSISCKKLSRLQKPVFARVVRKLCPKTLSCFHVEKLYEFSVGSGLGYLDCPGIRLRREQGRLFFLESEKRTMEERELIPGEILEIPELGIKISSFICIKDAEVNDLFKTYDFKYDDICGNIKVTLRKPGDNIRPVGRNCTKSLKKLFLEAAYTQAQRDSTPVFRDENGVLAVYGLAVDERCRAYAGQKILRIKIDKL